MTDWESATARREARRARCVGVAGASGGIGTSCLAAALATQAARRGDAVLCADATPSGGGIDALFDVESRPGARWPDLAQARGRLDGSALLRHLPVSSDGVHVLSAAAAGADSPPRAEESAGTAGSAGAAAGAGPRAVLAALAGVVDLVVLDLGAADSGLGGVLPPPGVSDLVLVVGAGVPALARAGRAAAVATAAAVDRVWLAQRCPRGGAHLADLVAEKLGLPLIGVVLDDPRLDDALARGIAPGAGRGRLADAAAGLWTALVAQERVA